MTADTPAPAAVAVALRPMLLMLAATAALVVMSALLKLGSAGLPPAQIVFFRCFFAIAPLLIWLTATGRLAEAVTVRRPTNHLGRTGFGGLSMLCFFTALGMIPLIDITVMYYASPLTMIWLSAIFLREPPTRVQAVASLVGLSGVLIAAWPQIAARAAEGGGTSATGALLALASAVFGACAMTSLRRASTSETAASIVFVFLSSIALLCVVSAAVWPWVWTGWKAFAILAAGGFFGGIGQILMTLAYKGGPLPMVSVMEYTSLIFAGVLGWLLFAEWPTVWTLAGAGFVVLAGAMVAYGATGGRFRRRRIKAAPPTPAP